MRIYSVEIKNYQSFHSTEEIKFASGFNTVVGANNSGKTAFLKAASLRFSNIPHRSLATVPTSNSYVMPISQVTIKFDISARELIEYLKQVRQQIFIPVYERMDATAGVRAFSKDLDANYVIEYTYGGDTNYINSQIVGGPENVDIKRFWQAKYDEVSNTFSAMAHQIHDSINHQVHFPALIRDTLRSKIYIFNAERYNTAQARIAHDRYLAPDASNLASVLHMLNGDNYHRFARLVHHIEDVFPNDIKHIGVPPADSANAEVQIWSVSSETERNDLAVSLARSGTGVSQVLAMLYVVMNSIEPQIIIIDEPQSFLHPGAIRKLFEILNREYSKHQYIISTHSPFAITSVDPQRVFLIQKKDSQSKITVIDTNDLNQVRLTLAEVGARLGDVFGADNVLWVEGTTEEKCFPLILSRIANRSLMGTVILGVIQTGDFDGKHSRTAFEIYRKLTSGQALIPPALGFIFDREKRSDIEIDNLKRQGMVAGNSRVWFLNRMLYENYLLNVHAIAALISTLDEFSESSVAPQDINDYLESFEYPEREYDPKPSIEDQQALNHWLSKVHGARVLEDIFRHFSESRYEYDKVRYGVALTTWIIENASHELQELVDLLNAALEQAPVS